MKTTPNTELVELARKIRGYQETRRWSDAATLKRFALLGSTKTYKRILGGDTAELDIDRQTENYCAVWEKIKALTGDADPEEELYEEVHGTAELLNAFLDIHETNTLDRIIILQGPTASGKSAARRVLMRQMNADGNRIVLVEASVAWGDSPMSMLGALLIALGKVEIPFRQMARYESVVSALRDRRRGVVIEEAHHMGPRCLNQLKSLLNDTPGEFVLCTIGTLWRRLETAAYAEAQQLIQNRMACRINLGDELRNNDVCTILRRRLGLNKETAERATSLVLPFCASYGRLGAHRRVVNRVAENADGEPVTLAMLAAAIAAEKTAR